MPGIEGKQPTEFPKEIRRAFYGFYLDVSVGPNPPRFRYILFLGPPLNPDSKRSILSLTLQQRTVHSRRQCGVPVHIQPNALSANLLEKRHSPANALRARPKDRVA